MNSGTTKPEVRRDGSGTVEKALDVLFFLHAQRRSCGVTAIERSLGVPKATAHRLLRSLAKRGLVERDEGGRYRPGIALVALGVGALEGEPVVAAAHPVLEQQADALGETLFLAGARGGRILVLDKCEGPGFLRAAPRVGAEVPAHATAIGKIFLAFAPEQVPVPPELERFTEHTFARGDTLAEELEGVRARGWSENREEWIPGLVGLAAPVISNGRLIAAIAVSGAAARFELANREVFIERITAAAQHVVERLEGRAQ